MLIPKKQILIILLFFNTLFAWGQIDTVIKNIENKLAKVSSKQLIYEIDSIQNNTYNLTDNQNLKLFLIKANCYQKQGDKENSSICLAKVKNRKSNNYELIIELLRNLAYSYVSEQKNDSALHCFYKAISIAENNSNVQKIATVYNDIGEYYRSVRKYSISKKYLFNSIKINNDSNDIQLGRSYHRLAAVYDETSQADSAIFYSEKSLKISEQNNLIDQQAISYNELGYLYSQSDYKLSLSYYQRALKIWNKLDYYRYVASVKNNLAYLYINMSEIKKALKLADELYVLSKEKNWKKIELDAITLYALIYEQKKDYKNALLYQKQIYNLNNQIILAAQSEKIEKIEAIHQLEISKNKINEVNLNLELSKLKYQKESRLKTFSQILFGIVLIVAILFIFIIIKLRTQKIELTLSNQKIKKAGKENEILLDELHHRIKNTFTILTSLLQLQIEKKTTHETNLIIKDIISRIKSISTLYENIYSANYIQKVKVSDFFLSMLQNIKQSYASNDKLEIIEKYQDVNIELQEMIYVAIIANELLTNSFKHAFKNNETGTIGIKIAEKNGFINITISDSGKGFDFEAHCSNSKSLGLYLVKLLTQQLEGSLEYTNIGKSEFKLIFPVKNEFKI